MVYSLFLSFWVGLTPNHLRLHIALTTWWRVDLGGLLTSGCVLCPPWHTMMGVVEEIVIIVETLAVGLKKAFAHKGNLV